MSDVDAHLRKAARSLDAAKLLLANEDADFAASRAYYGCSYVAEALLSDEGSSVSTHAGVIGNMVGSSRRLEGWIGDSTDCSTVRSELGNPLTMIWILIWTTPKSTR